MQDNRRHPSFAQLVAEQQRAKGHDILLPSLPTTTPLAPFFPAHVRAIAAQSQTHQPVETQQQQQAQTQASTKPPRAPVSRKRPASVLKEPKLNNQPKIKKQKNDIPKVPKVSKVSNAAKPKTTKIPKVSGVNSKSSTTTTVPKTRVDCYCKPCYDAGRACGGGKPCGPCQQRNLGHQCSESVTVFVKRKRGRPPHNPATSGVASPHMRRQRKKAEARGEKWEPNLHVDYRMTSNHAPAPELNTLTSRQQQQQNSSSNNNNNTCPPSGSGFDSCSNVLAGGSGTSSNDVRCASSSFSALPFSCIDQEQNQQSQMARCISLYEPHAQSRTGERTGESQIYNDYTINSDNLVSGIRRCVLSDAAYDECCDSGDDEQCEEWYKDEYKYEAESTVERHHLLSSPSSQLYLSAPISASSSPPELLHRHANWQYQKLNAEETEEEMVRFNAGHMSQTSTPLLAHQRTPHFIQQTPHFTQQTPSSSSLLSPVSQLPATQFPATLTAVQYTLDLPPSIASAMQQALLHQGLIIPRFTTTWDFTFHQRHCHLCHIHHLHLRLKIDLLVSSAVYLSWQSKHTISQCANHIHDE